MLYNEFVLNVADFLNEACTLRGLIFADFADFTKIIENKSCVIFDFHLSAKISTHEKIWKLVDPQNFWNFYGGLVFLAW